jgi:hypothetical protein
MNPLSKYFSACTAAVVAAVITGCATTEQSAPLDLTPRRLAEVRNSTPVAPSVTTARPTVALVLPRPGIRWKCNPGFVRCPGGERARTLQGRSLD